MGWGIGRVQLNDDEDDAESNVLSTDENSGGLGGGADHAEEEKQQQGRLWVIMVPHVVVGELVKVRIFRNQRNYSEGDLVEVIEPSPNRVEPRCSLAGLCGGCQYQHMSIAAQREWKTLHVQEVLLQQGIDGYDCVEAISSKLTPTIGTDEVFGYRSKLTPHYEAPLEIGLDTYRLDAIGFQQSSNRQLVDVPFCPIATPAINEALKVTREKLHEQAQMGLLNKKKKKRRRGSRGDKAAGATLLFRQADDDENGQAVVITDHNQYMTTTVKGVQFRYLAGNFFQNNNHVLPLMVDAVLEAAMAPKTKASTTCIDGDDGDDGDDKSQHHHFLSYLIDCYCGSGLFALSAAKNFTVCVGIEVNEKAIAEAQNNAKLNDIDNCHFVAASAEAIFTSPPTVPVPAAITTSVVVAGDESSEEDVSSSSQQRQLLKVSDFPRDDTVVVLDPPRKGCSTEFLEQLYQYSPQRIVYMSCGPATQARDAKGIVEIGGYDIVSIQPFDLFPQTKHIECLIVFEKRRRTPAENDS